MNEGSDGTLDWVKNEQLDYTYTPKNCGVCLAMNMMRTKVKTDYICFFNDDMYALPNWDKAFYDEIKKQENKLFFFSACVIQPHLHTEGGKVADYGDSYRYFLGKRFAERLRCFPVL